MTVIFKKHQVEKLATMFDKHNTEMTTWQCDEGIMVSSNQGGQILIPNFGVGGKSSLKSTFEIEKENALLRGELKKAVIGGDINMPLVNKLLE